MNYYEVRSAYFFRNGSLKTRKMFRFPRRPIYAVPADGATRNGNCSTRFSRNHFGTPSEWFIKRPATPCAMFRLFFETYSARYMICKQNGNLDENKSKPRTRRCRPYSSTCSRDREVSLRSGTHHHFLYTVVLFYQVHARYPKVCVFFDTPKHNFAELRTRTLIENIEDAFISVAVTVVLYLTEFYISEHRRKRRHRRSPRWRRRFLRELVHNFPAERKAEPSHRALHVSNRDGLQK